jgi:AraC family cel operon transcriptional repressor
LARYGEPYESRYLADLATAHPFKMSAETAERLKKMAPVLAQGPRDSLSLEWFLLVFLKEAASASYSSPKGLPFWLEKALQQLKEARHFSKDVNHFYGLCHRAPEHTARTCKKLLGKSPSALLNDVRLRGAASKLSMTGQEITRIALDCGFQSLSRFYALFKEAYGVAPGAFRKIRAVG